MNTARKEIALNILFWDIDGTLIKTSKAGLYAFNQAAQELWGSTVDFDNIQAAGMTDNYIAQQVIRSITHREPTSSEISALCCRYEHFLPGQLAAREGWILPSVKSILTRLHGRDEYKLLLLTGNSATGASLKLKHFGLDHFFDFSCSAFAGVCYQRNDIAQAALNGVQTAWGDTEISNIFVIGDTPHDVECGKTIGAKTIAVATGTYSLDQLNASCPWWAVGALPAAAEFEDKISCTTQG